MSHTIELRRVSKYYAGDDSVSMGFSRIDLNLDIGEFVAITGESGSGKSTLLNVISGLDTYEEGEMFVCGEDTTAYGTEDYELYRKTYIGNIFQDFNLINSYTVYQNIEVAMLLSGKRRSEIRQRALELIDLVGLRKYRRTKVSRLSGGQKQRVAIARTLCMDPEVILFDEPTSALDPTMVSEVQAVIRDLSASEKTMMIVTHEMNFARAISNRVLFMDEGGIYEEGTPEEIFERPKREKTRRFVRRLKVFESIIDSSKFDFYSFNASLDRYLMQNDVPPSEKYRIRLAIEEIVQQLLWPNLSDPKINITVEYSEADKISIVAVSYGGGRFDIRDSDNDIALSVLTKVAGDLDYHYSEEEGKNTATVKIREE